MIQKCDIYKRVKIECNKDLDIKSDEKMDMIMIIYNMLKDIRCSNFIHDIGAKKFYVFYCSPDAFQRNMSERGQIIDKLETPKENVEINKEIENTLNSVNEKMMKI